MVPYDRGPRFVVRMVCIKHRDLSPAFLSGRGGEVKNLTDSTRFFNVPSLRRRQRKTRVIEPCAHFVWGRLFRLWFGGRVVSVKQVALVSVVLKLICLPFARLFVALIVSHLIRPPQVCT